MTTPAKPALGSTLPLTGPVPGTPAESAVLSPAGEGAAFIGILRRRLLWIQITLIAAIACLHAALTWPSPGTFEPTLTQTFNVDHEMNFPTWFASIQHFLIALTLVGHWVVARLTTEVRYRAWIWACGAATAFYLSADEIAAFHERLGGFLEFALRSRGDGSPLAGLLGFPSYYWMLVYAPIVIPAVVGLSVFVWRELGNARRLALLGVFVFLYGAVGLDFIEGYLGTEEHTYLLLTVGNGVYNFDIFLLEEILEMTGLVLVLHALLTHLESRVARHLTGLAPRSSN